MDAMLVVDMQVGVLNGEPKHDLHGVIERIAVVHERGRGEDAAAMRFHNARIHVGRETEIIRVHH